MKFISNLSCTSCRTGQRTSLPLCRAWHVKFARQAKNLKDFDAAFFTRLSAFADTHDLLVTRGWRGTDVCELIRTQLLPFVEPNEGRLTSEGPDLILTPKAAEQIGLALHELGTNAATHAP